MTLRFVLVLGLAVFSSKECVGHYDSVSGNLKRVGPDIYPTQGEPWPKPQLLTNYGDQYMIFRPAIFRFEVIRNNCPLIEAALQRYYKIYIAANALITNEQRRINNTADFDWKYDKNFAGYLDSVEIFNMATCEEWPHDEMDESYEIKISTPDYKGKGNKRLQPIETGIAAINSAGKR